MMGGENHLTSFHFSEAYLHQGGGAVGKGHRDAREDKPYSGQSFFQPDYKQWFLTQIGAEPI
jgi:hypothetical protein